MIITLTSKILKEADISDDNILMLLVRALKKNELLTVFTINDEGITQYKVRKFNDNPLPKKTKQIRSLSGLMKAFKEYKINHK